MYALILSFRLHGRGANGIRQVRYSARGARSERGDPQRPVALENARDVPGLMTIMNRID